jgi:hypothetical protein
MAPVPAKVAAFARKNTYGAAGTGIVAQSAYHLLFTLSVTNQWWRVVLAAIVGALPPAVAGLAVHMRALIRRESSNPNSTNGSAALPALVQKSTPPAPSAPINQPTVHAAPTIDAGPAPSTTTPSPMGNNPTDPATLPQPVPSEVPTPATVAARITPTRPTTDPTVTPAVTRPATRTTRPRPTGPTTPAKQLAPSTTDTPVNASDAAQLTLPIVAPDVLARANQVARQYRTEHGTPITPGQLAVRLKVTSDQAAQALAVLNLDTDNPTTPTATVNGHRPKATR